MVFVRIEKNETLNNFYLLNIFYYFNVGPSIKSEVLIAICRAEDIDDDYDGDNNDSKRHHRNRVVFNIFFFIICP